MGKRQNRFGSVDRASVWGLKGPRFDSGQGHVNSLQSAGQCISLIDVSSSLSLSLPLCKKSIKYIKKRRDRFGSMDRASAWGLKGDRELETSMREKHRPAASCTPPTRDMHATNVHALDRNRTWDLSVCRPMLYPLSQSGFSPFTPFGCPVGPPYKDHILGEESGAWALV